MKTKKKILSVLISMGLILSLIACGEEKSKETTGVKDSTSVESTSDVENETDSSVVETTTMDKPITQESTMQGPTTQGPTTQGPTTQGPTTQEITTKEPTTQKPTTTSTPESTGSDSGNTTTNKGEQMAKTIVDSIIKPKMSELEKAIVINDWLTSNIEYDYTYTYSSVEATLTYKKCVCEGYASTYYIMAKLAGLEVVHVYGDADNGSGKGYEGHAWNQVKVDGVWYNIDPTWNDPYGLGNHYNYCLISDATLSVSHRWDKSCYNTCLVDYDVNKVFECGIALGSFGDTIIYSSDCNVGAEIEQLIKSGSSGITLFSDHDKSSGLWSYLGENSNFGKYDIPVYSESSGRYYRPNLDFVCITIIQPSELEKIPVVTNEAEFDAVYDKMVAQGVGEYKVRYETEDGNISYWSNGQPEGVGVLSHWYKGGKCGLIHVFIY